MKNLKNIKFFIVILISLSIVIFSVISAMQYERNVDYIKMRKNLKIMENILNTILTEYDKEILPIRSTKTSGIFVDGYGVVFITSPSLDAFPIATITKSLILGELTKQYQQYKREEPEKERDKKREEVLEELNNSIIGFLTDYAGAIKGLESDDRITVVCKIPSGYKEALEKSFGIEDSNIIVTVEKRWLNDYKKDLLNFAELKDRIKNTSKPQYSLKEMYKRIDILESIIQSEVENRYNRISRNQIEGIYINGLGTIFSLNFDRPNLFSNTGIVVKEKYDDAVRTYMEIEYDKLREQIEESKEQIEKEMKQLEKSKEGIEKAKEELDEAKEKIKSEVKIFGTFPEAQSFPTPKTSGIPGAISIIEKEKEEEKSVEEKVKELTDLIAEIFADFGSTLTEMKENERVEILITSSSLATKERKAGNVQFTINKSDIDDYDRDIIDLDTFKNRINIKIY